VTGAKLTTKFNYCQIAVTTNGSNVVVPVFGTTAPVSGTVTGMFISNGSTTAGTTVLMSTTAGTIASVMSGTTVGLVYGTTPLSGAVTAGDTVQVWVTTAGTTTAYITFQASA
jgi:hypothetical protein